mgnify:CR=1
MMGDDALHLSYTGLPVDNYGPGASAVAPLAAGLGDAGDGIAPGQVESIEYPV